MFAEDHFLPGVLYKNYNINNTQQYTNAFAKHAKIK